MRPHIDYMILIFIEHLTGSHLESHVTQDEPTAATKRPLPPIPTAQDHQTQNRTTDPPKNLSASATATASTASGKYQSDSLLVFYPHCVPMALVQSIFHCVIYQIAFNVPSLSIRLQIYTTWMDDLITLEGCVPSAMHRTDIASEPRSRQAYRWQAGE